MKKYLHHLFLVLTLAFVSVNAFSQQYKLNGDATQKDCNCVILTPFEAQKLGSAWNLNKLDLTKAFDLNFDLLFSRLNTLNNEGADGMAFVLHKSARDYLSPGGVGGGMGYLGLDSSLGIVMDTYKNAAPEYENDPSKPALFTPNWYSGVSDDHLTLMKNGEISHGSPEELIPAPIMLTELEDGKYKPFRVTWNPATKELKVWLSAPTSTTPKFTYVGDIVNDIFGGDPLVYWGFTAGTGAAFNQQSFCNKTAMTYEKVISRDTTCSGAIFDFNNFNNFYTGSVASYSWDFGDGNSSATSSGFIVPPSHVYALQGDYKAILTYNIFGTCPLTQEYFINVSASGTVSISSSKDNVCKDENFNLQIASTGSFTLQSTPAYSGTFAKGANNVSLTQTTKFKISSGTGICLSKDSVTVTVLPSVDLVLSSQNDVCLGTNVSLAIGQTGLSNYKWQVSTDGVTYKDTLTSIASQSLTNLKARLYYFRVKHDNGTCVSTSNVTSFRVSATPVITLSAPTAICSNTNFNFNINTGGNAFTVNATPSFAGALVQGDNSIKLSAGTTFDISSGPTGCVATKSITVNVTTKTPITITPIPDKCYGPNTILKISQGNVGAIVWQVQRNSVFKDTLTTNFSQTLAALKKGNYVFRAIYNHGACQDTSAVEPFAVTNVINLNLPDKLTICENQEIVFPIFVGSTFVTTTYPNRNIDIVFGINRINIPDDTKFVTEVTDLSGCKEKDSVDVIVQKHGVLTLAPIADVCVGTDVSVDIAQKGLSKYTWQVSHDNVTYNDTLSSLASHTLTGLKVNDYYLRVVHSDGTCSDTSNLEQFKVKAIPTLSITNDASVCAYTPANVNITTTGTLSFTSTPVYSGTLVSGSNSLLLSQTTNFAAKAILNGCEKTQGFNISVIPAQALTLLPISDVCFGTNVTASISQTGLSNYKWQVSHDGIVYKDTLAPQASHILTGLKVNDYYLRVIYANGTCSDTSNVLQFKVKAIPTLSITNDASVCASTPANVNITTTGTLSFTSTPVYSGTLVSGPNSLLLSQTTNFTAKSSLNGCEKTQGFNISVIPAQALTLAPISDVCFGTNVTASIAQTGLSNYKWQVSHDGTVYKDTLTSQASHVLTGLKANDYYLRVIYKNGTCSDTSNVEQFKVKAIPKLSIVSDPAICASTLANVNITNTGVLNFTSVPSYTGTLVSGANSLPLSQTTNFTAKASLNGCEKTQGFNISVIPAQALTLAPISDVCFGTNVTASIIQTGLSNYKWQVSHDGIVYKDTLTSQASHVLTGLKANDYYLRVIYKNGTCSDTSNVEQFKVKAIPKLSIVSDPAICASTLANVNITNTGVLNFTSVPSYTGTLVSGANSLPLSQTTKFTVTSSLDGCDTIQTFDVTLITLQKLTLEPIIDICLGENVSATSIAFTIFSNYTWQVSHDGTVYKDTLTSQASHVLTGLKANDYYLRVIYANGTCSDTSNVSQFKVKAIPTLSITNDASVCASTPANVNITTTGTLSFTSTPVYSGTLVSGSNSLLLSQTTNFTAKASLNGCEKTQGFNISVIPAQALTLAPISDVCFGTNVTASVAQTGLSNYTWQVSHDGIVYKDTLTSQASHILNSLKANDYYLRVIYANGTCSDTSNVLQFKVKAIPTLSITNDASVCASTPANANITTTGTLSFTSTPAYSGTLVSGPNSLLLNQTTNFTAKSSLNGCDKTQTFNIAVITAQALTLAPIADVCFGTYVTASITQTGLSNYKWQVSHDGIVYKDTLTSQASHNLTGLKANNYYLRVIYANGTCSDTSNVSQFKVKAIPTLNITNDASVCASTPANVNITTTGTLNFTSTPNYTGTLVSGPNSLLLSQTTNFTAKASLDGCEKTQGFNISVIPAQALTLAPISDVCFGTNVTAKITQTGLSNYKWQVSHDGLVYKDTLASQASHSLIGLKANDYYLRVIYVNATCSDTSNVSQFKVKAIPTLSITNDASVCASTPANANITTTGTLSFTSTPVYSGTLVSGPNSLALSQTTNFTAKVSLNGCDKTQGFNIAVIPAQALTLAPISDVCFGTNVTASISQTGLSNYKWQVSHDGTVYKDTLVSQSSHTLTGLKANQYFLRVANTNAQNCSAMSNAVKFNVIGSPTLDFVYDPFICIGNEATIDVSSNGNIEVNYNPGINGALVLGDNKLKLTETTTFDVKSGATGCSNSKSFTVQVIKPSLVIENTQSTDGKMIVGTNLPVTLKLNTNTLTQKWFLNNVIETQRANSKIENFVFTDNSILVVQGAIQGCQVSDTLSVEVVKEFVIPVLISPNGDNENDYFTIQNSEILQIKSVTIFNRWGAKMYEAGSEFEKWDGTYNGNPSPNGTYYYVIELINQEKGISGYFTLMR